MTKRFILPLFLFISALQPFIFQDASQATTLFIREVEVIAPDAPLETNSTAEFANDKTAKQNGLSLKGAVRYALINNHELKALASNLAAGREDIGMARSHLFPKVTLEERFMRTSNPTYGFMAKLNQQRFTQQDFMIDSLNDPAPINDYQTALSLEQPLFMPKINIGLGMAKVEHKAKTHEFRRRQEKIALDVSRAYLMARAAREFVTAGEKAVEDGQEQLRIAKLRYANGLGLYSDTLRAETALTSAKQQLTSAKKNKEVANRTVGLLLGMPEAPELSGESPQIPIRELEDYLAVSGARNDLNSLKLRRENARNNLKMVKSDFLPTVGVGSSYQLNDHQNPFGSEGDSWQVMGFLKWELFTGLRRGHEKAKAQHQINETSEYLKGLESAVSFKVREAYLGVTESRANNDLARTALKTSEEGWRLVKVRYENSLSPMVDLLVARANLDQARANMIASDMKQREAVLNLAYESGTILKDLDVEIQEENK